MTVQKIAVQEQYRRRGVGSALLHAAISIAVTKRRVEFVTLHVSPENTRAVYLYHRFGFKVAATLHDYYLPGKDAYKMELDL